MSGLWSKLRELRHDGDFWRRAASFGAQRGPSWFVRYSPPLIGLAWWAALPAARRTVRENLARVRGPQGVVRNTVDTARTFTTFAGCLAETLSNGSPNQREVHARVEGPMNLYRAVREKKGLILATMHTGGWEATGQLLGRELGFEVMVVMRRERDEAARVLQDRAREVSGLKVAHVGDDPLEALPLLRHLKRGGAVAMQLDGVPKGMRSREVTFFGERGRIPEGPLRLAQLSGSPVVPVFCARLGFWRYLVHVDPPFHVERRLGDAMLDAHAQTLADAMARFVDAHPTQWMKFEPLTDAGRGA
jgi:KDO2-lipid IV(A) lauroyltransferase